MTRAWTKEFKMRFFLCSTLVLCWSIHLSNSLLSMFFTKLYKDNVKRELLYFKGRKTWVKEALRLKLRGVSHPSTDVSMLSSWQRNERIRLKRLVGESVALKPMQREGFFVLDWFVLVEEPWTLEDIGHARSYLVDTPPSYTYFSSYNYLPQLL